MGEGKINPGRGIKRPGTGSVNVPAFEDSGRFQQVEKEDTDAGKNLLGTCNN